MTNAGYFKWMMVLIASAPGWGESAARGFREGPSASSKEPLTVETLWRMKRLGAPTISPDGRWIALTVTQYDVEKNEGLTDIWLVASDGSEKKPLTTDITKESEPSWSPDGRWIAFIAKRGQDKEPQLYVIPTDGGEARRVTNLPTGVSAPRWFPDSRRLAFIARVWPDLTWEQMEKKLKERADSKVTAQVWEGNWIRYWDHWIDEREAHLYFTSREGGDPRPITLGTGLQLSRSEPNREAYDVSPEGTEIAFAADTDPTGVDSNYDIHVMPVEGGRPVNLTTDNPADDTRPRYGPAGRKLAFSRQVIKGFYADKQRLMIYDRRDETLTDRTEVWDRSAEGVVWGHDGKTLFGAVEDKGVTRVYRFNAEAGLPRPVTADHGFSSLDVAPDDSHVVALRESFIEPLTLVRIDPLTARVTKLSDFNDELLQTIDFGTYESVTYKGADDADVQMWINYPPGFDENQKWPVYLLLHGGPHGQVGDGFHWRWNAQVFSAFGCVTAWPNFHGSSGFGQAFCDSINPDWASKPYEDVIKAARHLMDRPWCDADRLAAGGGSYGGYLAALILGRDHPFQTLIVHAGVYNLYTQYAADYGAEKRRHGEHWENPERFNAISPHGQAANFKTPTLVIHGQNDYRVPVNHGIELYQTLLKKGVRTKFIYYPDENHWILSPQNSIHWHHAVQDWLAEHLGTPPAPTPEKKEKEEKAEKEESE